MDVGLLDHRRWRLLGHPARLQKGRELRTAPELQDAKFDVASAGFASPLAVAVALGQAVRLAFAMEQRRSAERDQLIEHVRPCSPVSREPLPASTRITIDVVTEKDGSVLEGSGVTASAVLLSGGYGPAERNLTDRAKRAILDPRCRKLPIPARLLGHWQSFLLVFAP